MRTSTAPPDGAHTAPACIWNALVQGSEDVLAARDAISAWSNAAVQACLLHKGSQPEADLLRPVLSAVGSCLDAIVASM